jgi:microsomal epoxide hydrolase
MARARAITGLVLAGLLLAGAAHAADRYFRTSDGVRLHYLEAGHGRTIVMVPGWTMPAWIFDAQIAAFSRTYHVVAFDPRSQGSSEVAPDGYEPARRGADIGELLDRLGSDPVLLLGWSLGVLDSLAYISTHGDARLAGLVLVDNSVGEEPAPIASAHPVRFGRSLSRSERMRRFVAGMFLHPQPPLWLERLAEACLHTPPAAAEALLSYPVPRTYWRDAVYSTERPVLYVVRQGLAGQAANLAAHRPNTETVVMAGVGHAMFVDDPARFNAVVDGFIHRRVWP